MFVEVTWEKLVGSFFASPYPFLLTPILKRAKIKRAQETKYNQFFFQNVQNNEIFEIFKMFKNNR